MKGDHRSAIALSSVVDARTANVTRVQLETSVYPTPRSPQAAPYVVEQQNDGARSAAPPSLV